MKIIKQILAHDEYDIEIREKLDSYIYRIEHRPSGFIKRKSMFETVEDALEDAKKAIALLEDNIKEEKGQEIIDINKDDYLLLDLKPLTIRSIRSNNYKDLNFSTDIMRPTKTFKDFIINDRNYLATDFNTYFNLLIEHSHDYSVSNDLISGVKYISKE